MRNKMLKELIIIFLLVLVIVFSMIILFYDSITEDVDEIIATQYTRSEDVNEVLDEIKAKGGESEKPSTSDSLLKSYSINAEDLNRYASENYYESGKKDPFAENSEKIEEHTTTTVQTGTATQSQTSNPIINTNTVTSEKDKNSFDTNTSVTNKKDTNTIQNTVSTSTMTTTNTISKNKTNTVNTISKDKNESSSSTVGTFFENKNSK